ncbi:ATP-dependent DNA helicase [Paenibacillus doosanensis]|uniref:Bifunctional ATP-dependent DNA helicase/DNA polymerase III subunit epsilon n=1 Tax=Paenibacillus konkukensis TaxID=2020716 RepID=A0ABY4RDX0_9BACL|nr:MULTISPECIES: ATP-dependent DNA helicase [Paenibacillus]MCS7461552.1 ATP-dependent DNA helicase [Paenibacillus doosanensis]UQZ80956.1 bifunctional ATP-dependent DNA helicase/DNA polymerase III subunit epsilon [Paenibacillus konkukensis]
MTYIVKVSVRSLVEYAHRAGSIDAEFRTNVSLQEGTKAHQQIQKSYAEHDLKEVHLAGILRCGELELHMEGRCDGILQDSDGVTIDEIKSTAGSLERIDENTSPVHWSQAYCYAYLYVKREGLQRLSVRLTYVQVDTGQQKRFLKTVSAAELESIMQSLAAKYAPYAKLQLEHEERRNRSIRELSFPFDEYRQGQRKLAGAVYQAIIERQKLFVKAPTGTGKTISTLFPAVKAIGEGKLLRVFYLTAKTIARTAAEQAVGFMQSRGLHLRCATLTAKEKICFKEETRCRKEYCEYANGYYDRINAAVLDLLNNETMLTRGTFETYARKHTVCPFEFSLDVSYIADAIVCDYNYVFDPRTSLKRLYEEQKKQTVLLVDEAHNLVDRGREMFSAELGKASFLQLKKEYKGRSRSVADAAKAVNDYFIGWRKAHAERKTFVQPALPEQLLPLVEAFAAAAEEELASAESAIPAGPSSGGEAQRVLLETYFAAQSFIRIAGYYNDAYVTYGETTGSDVRIKLFCLDPSALLNQISKGYGSQVFFSATLSPLSYYRDMLGGTTEDYALTLPSPFRKEQLDVLLLPLSTRYRDRELTKGRIADGIHRLLREKEGNYLLFFPSYEYMNEVYERFMERSPCAEVLVQQPVMAEEEREAFLEAFQPRRDRRCVGFAVMGGIFSEGIDLTGERLTGTVVVGVGLPQVGLERDIIKDYFDAKGRNGFDYAYVYPGINKVLQAGGRLIRTEADRGTLLLVDDRFAQAKYGQLLPEEWKPLRLMELTGEQRETAR